MAFWDISFKIKYSYPFLDISEEFPGSRISMWCVWDAEMIHVPPECEKTISRVESYVKDAGLSIENYKKESNGYSLFLKCSCGINHNVWHVMDKNHCVPRYPAEFLDGWGYYRMFSRDEELTKKFFQDIAMLGPVDLIKKRRIDGDPVPPSMWVESLFSKLTERQIESIVKAYDYGYYSTPRDISTESLAKTMGINRSAYEQHLRKSENKIMDEIVPYLKLLTANKMIRES